MNYLHEDIFFVFQVEKSRPAVGTAAIMPPLPEPEAKRKKRNKRDPNAGLLIPRGGQLATPAAAQAAAQAAAPAATPAATSATVSKNKLKAFFAKSDDNSPLGGGSKLQNLLKLL